MPVFDKFTTEHWSVSFPSEWVDRTEGNDTLYFESPQGEKGIYVTLWRMSEQEPRTPIELVKCFQSTELESFFPECEGWVVLNRVIDQEGALVQGFWDGINQERCYRISGKQLAAGRFVLRATFHDYDCADLSASAKAFEPIIASLQLLEA